MDSKLVYNPFQWPLSASLIMYFTPILKLAFLSQQVAATSKTIAARSLTDLYLFTDGLRLESTEKVGTGVVPF